jgi:very-short-patch-repair endonuclease
MVATATARVHPENSSAVVLQTLRPMVIPGEGRHRDCCGFYDRRSAPEIQEGGMDTADHIRLACDDFTANARQTFNEIYRRAAKQCESEIEKILLANLIARCAYVCEMTPCFFLAEAPTVEKLREHQKLLGAFTGFVSGTIVPQVTIEGYRVDFLIQYWSKSGAELNVVVECDGHDWHERTPQQAARDKRRDRRLQKLGYQVLRFTGSEIFNRPVDCAEEIRQIIHDWERAEGEKAAARYRAETNGGES